MQRYQCHKIVEAERIVRVLVEGETLSGGSAIPKGATILELASGNYVDLEARHHPHAGGYYVRYQDGYKSFSPASAFEEGYTKVGEGGGGIGWALNMLEARRKVARLGWNGKGQYLGLQKPDAQSANTLPYVYIVTVQGERVPWICSQTDLLAFDWQIVE